MIKLILVEGPDGSGKTSLIKKLQRELNLPLHERFCNSDGSPTQSDPRILPHEAGERDGLFYHAFQDTSRFDIQPISIYDRHAMISEYVYGPVVRGRLPEEFTTPTADRMIRMIAERSMLVLCRPPLDRLISSVTANDQMDGVVKRIHHIKAAYDALYVYWPGMKITYDFTNDKSLAVLMSRARLFIASRTQELAKLGTER